MKRRFLQAEGRFALLAGHGKYGTLFKVDLNPNIGIFAFETAGFLKRANLFAIATGQAPIEFDENDFHFF